MLCDSKTFVWIRSITIDANSDKHFIKISLGQPRFQRFQSLPIRVATCAAYLLLGALPLEAELHKRQLGLLYNILISDNETVKELTERQIAVNLDNRLSYFSKVQELNKL